jgi:cytochrome d ubiquinol oxidase subunit II
VWAGLLGPLLPGSDAGRDASALALGLHAATGLCALATIGSLLTRRLKHARLAAPAFVGLVVLGWAASQYPLVIAPDLEIAAVAAPRPVLRAVLAALALGSVLLIPALVLLFRLFKGRDAKSGSPHHG